MSSDKLTVFITGASRGIGRECALAFAERGHNVVIAAKSTEPQPTLPGTIYTVAKEVERAGGRALAVKLDVRDAENVKAAVKAAVDEFGTISVLINNASALWWKSIVDTPIKKFDLIHGVNDRGTFLLTQAVLPVMEKGGFGHIINMSPPIELDLDGIRNRTAYLITKFGMTMCALGVAAEYGGRGIAANTLWPATVVESLASKNFQMGSKAMWRKASILSDAVLGIVAQDPCTFTGNMLIDEDFLRDTMGVSDFSKYRCDPDVEPPKMKDLEVGTFVRGKVPSPKEREEIRKKFQAKL